MPTILMIMLCIRCALGGAEKRYARVFEMLVAQTGAQHRLLINRSMLELLQSAGILLQHEPYLVVLQPPFRTGVLNALWYVWRCWQAVHRYRPDVVHPLLAGILFSLPALLFHPQVRHVMSAYTSYVSPFESIQDRRMLGMNLQGVTRGYATRRCQTVDALSMSIRDQLVSHGIGIDKIQVAPCSFSDYSLCQPALRREKWVVFLGRFIATKNPLLLARAIPKVLDQDPGVHFYFLGRGILQPKLESLVRDLNVVSNVTIRFDPRPTRVLSQSSVFVSLQADNNYPSQSLLEAMACGNAIVATDVGETWRLVDDTNGIRIPPTADAVADAIITLLEDPQLSQRGLASRQRVLSEHIPERFFAYITSLYQAAMKATPS
jgi:glycosyltransferase involved in cell wall biosynthesis